MKRIKINHHMKTRKETIKFEKFIKIVSIILIKFEKFIKIIDTISIFRIAKQFAFE